jgi:hypothetical protein
VYTFAGPDQELAIEYAFSTWRKSGDSGARGRSVTDRHTLSLAKYSYS